MIVQLQTSRRFVSSSSGLGVECCAVLHTAGPVQSPHYCYARHSDLSSAPHSTDRHHRQSAQQRSPMNPDTLIYFVFNKYIFPFLFLFLPILDSVLSLSTRETRTENKYFVTTKYKCVFMCSTEMSAVYAKVDNFDTEIFLSHPRAFR